MLKNARLGVRIGIGFAVVLIMTVLVAVVGLYSMQRLQGGFFLAEQADEVVAQVLRAREMEKEYIVSADRGAADNARERLNEVITVTKDMTDRIANPQARELLGLIQEDIQEYQDVIAAYVDLEGQRVQAGQSMEQAAQKLESIAQFPFWTDSDFGLYPVE